MGAITMPQAEDTNGFDNLPDRIRDRRRWLV